ncbi:sigma-54 dependent transcriptional regulator [Desulfobacterales bacterium HSG2]|nr:sigma-54 dependent transcriptional regulator [Desulfobacterales bacterium HSG2]
MKKKFQETIMVVDDSETVLLDIRSRLSDAGMERLITCKDSRQVMGMLSEHPVGILVLDLVMPHISGEDLLEQISQGYPEIPIIILTGTDDVDTAVRCMKLGAFDYVIKGEDINRLANTIRHGLKLRELARENERLMRRMQSHQLENPRTFEGIITENGKMLSIFQYVETVAPDPYPVLITGETGVGKELIAGSLHKASGREGQMVPVNLAGLDDSMFSDTLFGHLRGAYTGASDCRKGLIEEAVGGTLFLDEIGDLSHESQVKLLRLLQEGEYLPLGCDKHRRTDARIVAATNRNLWELYEDGKFREDLIYRLKTHHIHIPPLRERPGDIPLLTEFFVREACRKVKKEVPEVPAAFTALLETCPFPGNVRELKSLIADTVVRNRSGRLSPDIIETYITEMQENEDISPFDHMKKLPTLKQVAHMLIDEAMRRSGGKQILAAKLLGTTQSTLSERLKKRREASG